MLKELLKVYRSVDTSLMRSAEFLMQQEKIELDKIKRVLNGSGFKDVSMCPLCESKDNELELTKHSINLMHCLVCDVRYSARIPADLNDIYDDVHYVVHSKEDSDEHFNYRRTRFGSERVNILEALCGDLTDKQILDIGCGTGFFISAASEKCEHVYGSEYSDIRRTEAVRRTGLTVFSETLEKLPKRDFDIITAFDVLEHVPEPIPFMRSIDEILNQDGYLFIYVPNFDSFSMMVMRDHSPAVDATEHVLLYNHSSLRFLAEVFDYEIVYAETHGMDIDNILSMSEYLHKPTDKFLVEWKRELQAMINAAQCADSLRIILKKR